jgi:hypothetical protein
MPPRNPGGPQRQWPAGPREAPRGRARLASGGSPLAVTGVSPGAPGTPSGGPAAARIKARHRHCQWEPATVWVPASGRAGGQARPELELRRPGAGHSNLRHGPRGTEHLPPPPAPTPSPTTIGSVALRQRTKPLEQPRRARQVVRVPKAADTFLPWYVVSRTLHAVMRMTVHSERAFGASPLGGAAAVRSGLNGAGTGSRGLGRAPVLPPL